MEGEGQQAAQAAKVVMAARVSLLVAVVVVQARVRALSQETMLHLPSHAQPQGQGKGEVARQLEWGG